MKRPLATPISAKMRRPIENTDKRLTIISDKASGSPCWRCSDSPCISLENSTSNLPDIEELGSIFLTTSSCPFEAISIGRDGYPIVVQEKCIGCGLCLTNCPTGAINLDESTGTALVNSSVIDNGIFDEKIFEFRKEWSQEIRFEEPNENQINLLLSSAKERLLAGTPATNYLRSRLFVRNSLLSLGAKTALRTQGANSLLSELVAQEGDQTYLIEIETGDDTLDAFRRLVSAAARGIGGLGLEKERLVLILILPQLPNRRVDFYRLVRDARIYLNLRILVIPFAMLMASTILRRRGLESTFGGFSVEEGNESLEEVASAVFGVTFSAALGTRPSK